MNECKLVAMLVTIVAINTVLLGGIVYKGNEYYRHIRHQTEPIRQIGAVLNGNAPPEPLEQHLGMLLGDVVGDFFFGTFDGSIAAFAQNMMTTDFAKIGTDFTALANSVEAVFDGTECGTRTCDHANQKIDCGGRRRYCTAKGEVIRCDDAGPCFGPTIAQGAAAVRSVSDKIATVKTITTTATAPAAFSNGIFRMDAIMSWLDEQSNWAGWESASQVVSNFVQNLRYIDFSGCARDSNGERENCWDINEGIGSFADVVNEVSGTIKKPGPRPFPRSPSPGSNGGVTPSPNSPSNGGTPSTSSSGSTNSGSTQSTSNGGKTSQASSGAATSTTPSPSTTTPAPGSTEPPARTFTVELLQGTDETAMIAAVAAALNIPVSDIKVTSDGNGKVTFEFVGSRAGQLSQELETLTTGNKAEQQKLGMSGISSSPTDVSTSAPKTGGDSTLYIVLGCCAGGLLIGVIVGVVILKNKGSSEGSNMEEGTLLHPVHLNERETTSEAGDFAGQHSL